MTTKTTLQIALDERIAPITEHLDRLRNACGLQYLADVCTEHANALAELALRAEGNDVGGTNCIPHFLASLGAIERDMSRIEVASTGLANILADSLNEQRVEAEREGEDAVTAVDTITLTFATRLAHRYPHFDAVAFMHTAGVHTGSQGSA